MEGVEKELEGLPGRGGLGSVTEAVLKGDEGAMDAGSEEEDLVPELEKGGAHADDDRVDIDEVGSEADKVGVVAVNEVDEVAV